MTRSRATRIDPREMETKEMTLYLSTYHIHHVADEFIRSNRVWRRSCPMPSFRTTWLGECGRRTSELSHNSSVIPFARTGCPQRQPWAASVATVTVNNNWQSRWWMVFVIVSVVTFT